VSRGILLLLTWLGILAVSYGIVLLQHGPLLITETVPASVLPPERVEPPVEPAGETPPLPPEQSESVADAVLPAPSLPPATVQTHPSGLDQGPPIPSDIQPGEVADPPSPDEVEL